MTKDFWKRLAGPVALALLCTQAWAVPAISHSPVSVAERGKPIGLRATVTDASARVTDVTLYYALSRSSTPFRVEMASSGAGLWYGTIPGHVVGPGTELFYYFQAENADGETRETDWQTVKVVAPAAGAPAAIPSASQVGNQAAATAVPTAAPQRGVGTAASSAPKVDNSKKYWVTAGIIAGGAVAVGGAIALSSNSGGGGGGGGGDGVVTNGNFGGSYTLTFTADPQESGGETNEVASAGAAAETVNGQLNVYVKGSTVEIVGLWGGEVITGSRSGNSFSAAKSVGATGNFPAAHLSVSGSFSSSTACSASVSGTSSDTARPGSIAGSFSGTLR